MTTLHALAIAAAITGGAGGARFAAAQQILLDQLPWDGQNATRSIQYDGPFPAPSARTCDDFTPPTGSGGRWHITRISAVLLLQGAATPASCGFEVYPDAGAIPVAPADSHAIHSFTSTTSQYLGSVAGLNAWLFTAGDNTTTLFTAEPEQRIWISAFLRTMNPADEALLGVFSNAPPLNGSTAFFRDDALPRAEWISLAECCGEPADMALRIEGSQRPPSDECPSAIPLTAALTPFDTSGATTDGPAESSCNSEAGAGDWPHADIWFTYTAPATLGACNSNGTGPLTFSLCQSTFDTSLAVYLASCPTTPGQAIACNDDAPSLTCGDGRQSSVTFTATAGATYLLRLGGRAGATGSGIIEVIVNPHPPNDLCANRIPLTAGASPFCNIGATTQFFSPEDQQCGFAGFPENDVWYEYTSVAQGPITFDACGDGISPRLLVYVNGCPESGPTGGTLVSCGVNYPSGCGPGHPLARQRFLGPAGVTYLLRLGVNSSPTGRGTLTIYCPGDFNRSGSITPQDIFDYLAAFFASLPSAEYDGAPTISPQDLFDFIAAWFTPCP